MKNFLEQLFDHDSLTIDIFENGKLNVKSSNNLKHLTKELQKLLRENYDTLREAFLKDVKSKFPILMIIDVDLLKIKLVSKKIGWTKYSPLLTKILQDAINSSPQKTAYKLILNTFLQNQGWSRDNQTERSLSVKSSDQLHIIMSQLYHIFNDKLKFDNYIKSWKNFHKIKE